MSDTSLLPANSDTPKEVSIATTLIPWRKDDYRARFMGYLACGFYIDEALYVLGLNMAWLEEQREDESFNAIELKIPEIRKELSKEYIELDFFRNFRLVLEKDHRVLDKAIHPGDLSKQDHEYLLKLRSAYTPQQLQILEQVMKGVGGEGFNLARWMKDNQEIIQVSRTDTITVRNKLSDGEIQGKDDFE